MTEAAQKPQSYTQVLEIRLPPLSPWQPKIVETLMTSVFSLYEPLSLIIQASPQAIVWQIEIPTRKLEALTQLLFGIYPQASIQVEPKTETAIGWYQFHFHTAHPYIFPLLFAHELADQDPLAAVTSAMGTMETGERLTYELRLRTVRNKYRELGIKLLQELPTDDNRRKLAGDKLQALLKEVEFMVKIKAASEQRAFQLIEMVYPALAVFDSKGFNYLIPAQDDGFHPVLSAQEVAAVWHLPTEYCQHPLIQWAGSASAPLGKRKGSKAAGVLLGENAYQGKTQPVNLHYADRVTHVNIIGKTGVGKSTLMHHMLHQDIAAGKGVGVIDPQGKLVESILSSSIPPEREQDVIVFDIHDHEYPIGLNLLAVPPDMETDIVASQTLGVIRKMFAKDWSKHRMEDSLYAALAALLAVEGTTIQDVPRLFFNSDFRHSILKQVTDPTALEFWYDEFESLSDSFKREFGRPIASRIRSFYRNRHLQRVMCQQGSLDFRHVLDNNHIFLASLAGISDVEAETLGALLISKFQIAAMSRSLSVETEPPPFYLYVDEVQNFTTTSLPTLFSEARKFGINLVVANQYLRQLEGDTLESILGNTGTNILFGLGVEDAPKLASLVKPQFSAPDLQNLHRFHTVVKMQGHGETLPAFSMTTQPPLPIPKDAAERRQRIRTLSRDRYARPKAQVDEELLARYASYQRQDQPTDGDTEVQFFG